jgi:hypothetical protein
MPHASPAFGKHNYAGQYFFGLSEEEDPVSIACPSNDSWTMSGAVD